MKINFTLVVSTIVIGLYYFGYMMLHTPPPINPWELKIYPTSKHSSQFYTTGMKPKYEGDACLDLRVSSDIAIDPNRNTVTVPYHIQAGLFKHGLPHSFMLIPRSSLFNSGLSTQSPSIIDAGYRGLLDSRFSFTFRGYAKPTILTGTALIQLCTPDLQFPLITVVNDSLPLIDGRGDQRYGSSGNTFVAW